MEKVSPEQVEITRKIGARIHGEILQRLALVTQDRAADCMGISASTVSRSVKEDLDKVCQLLAAIGFQLASSDSVVISQSELTGLETMTFKYLQAKLETRRGG